MIDQCEIHVFNDITIPLKPEVFSNPNFLIDDWLRPVKKHENTNTVRDDDGPQNSFTGSLEIFADRALRVSTRQIHPGSSDRHAQKVTAIHINPGKILRGHNGRPIRGDEELCIALTVARHALRGIVQNPDDASKLIPGLAASASSYWHQLEIPMNLNDPGQSIFKLMARMRSPLIRRNVSFFENTTLLKGEKLELKAYDKVAQMESKPNNNGKGTVEHGENPITRLELVLKMNKFPKAFDFMHEAERPRLETINGKVSLMGFNLDHLKAAHRHYFSGLKGIYHASKAPEDKNTEGFGAVLAAISLRWDIPVPDILDLYTTVSKKTDAARREMRKRVERFLSESSVVTAETLLSDEAYESQPSVRVKGYDGSRFYTHRYGIDSADADILKAYASEQSRNNSGPSDFTRF